MADREADYVVVGSGAGGAVVAGRLAEGAAGRVIVLEAGGPDHGLIYKIPGLGFLASFEQSSNWGFVTEAMPTLGGRQLIFLQGKIVGGSSSINGMVYTRGHPNEYDLWRQMGCEGWSFREILPFFKKLEGHERGEDEWHGGAGPIKLRRSRKSSAIGDLLAAAFARDGVPTIDDFDDGVAEGFGYFDANIARGLRVSAASAYLKPALARGGLELLTNAEATTIVFENDRAVAVQFERDGRRETVKARREIVLAGGAIKTPQLLMLSGVGPAAELMRHGVTVRVDAPNVGRNLQNHPSFRMEYVTKLPITNFAYAKAWRAALAGIQYALFRRGVLSETFVPVGGIIRSRPDLEIADVQFVVAAALIPKLAPGKHSLRAFLPRREGFTFTIYQGSPYSRGTVTLRSANHRDSPVITPNYLSDERDLDVATDAVARIRRIVERSDIAPHVEELRPGPNVKSRTELMGAIRANIGTSYHQSGTCAMGGDATSVTDPQLRVRGVRGLRVADASVIPLLPNTALHGPVMMIGEKAAAMIREDER